MDTSQSELIFPAVDLNHMKKTEVPLFLVFSVKLIKNAIKMVTFTRQSADYLWTLQRNYSPLQGKLFGSSLINWLPNLYGYFDWKLVSLFQKRIQ